MEVTTMTGKTLDEVLQILTAVLPARAYSEFKGMPGDLTDISPAFLTEALTEAFGPVGFGWFYEVPSGIMVEELEKPKSGGGSYMTWDAQIDEFHMYYRLWIDGEERVSNPIISNGGNDNTRRHFAIRGAITQAKGGAAKELCWQLLVYKDILNHRNARDMRARYLAAMNKTEDDDDEPQTKQTVEKPIGKVPKPPAPPAADPETGEVVDAAAGLSEDVVEWLSGNPTIEEIAKEAKTLGYRNPGQVFTTLSKVLGGNWKKHGATEVWGVLTSQAGKQTNGNGNGQKATAKGGAPNDGPPPHPWPPAMWRKMFAVAVEESKLKGKSATNAQKRDISIAFRNAGVDEEARHDFQAFVIGKASLTEFTAAEGVAMIVTMRGALDANTFEDELTACLTEHYKEQGAIVQD